jgi:hypothetical protein
LSQLQQNIQSSLKQTKDLIPRPPRGLESLKVVEKEHMACKYPRKKIPDKSYVNAHIILLFLFFMR